MRSCFLVVILCFFACCVVGCGESDRPLPYKTPPRTVGVFDGKWSVKGTNIYFVIHHPFPDPPVISAPTQAVARVSYTNVTTHGRTLKFEQVATNGVRTRGTLQISINDVHYAMLTLYTGDSELEQSSELLYRIK